MRFALTRFRGTRLLVAGAVVGLVGAAAAVAGVFVAGSPVRVPDNPLGARAADLVAQQTALGSLNFPDAEVEPYVAVDPTNPKHLIGSVQQDRWNDGGANGLTNVVSTDGGATWTSRRQPAAVHDLRGRSPGSPGFFDRATDPWVSFSADGKIAYSISDSFNANGPAFGGASSIIISRSTDGGMTMADAGHRAARHLVHRAERQGVDDRRPVDRQQRLRRLGPARIAEQNANPGAFNHSPAFRGPAHVLEDDRRRRDLEQRPGRLRPGREEPDDRQPDRRARPPGRPRAC